jgi:hypothetical protein
MHQTSVEPSGSASWIASLMSQLLEEVRVAPLGDAARTRVAAIQDRSVSEPEQHLATDVVEELNGNTLPFTGRETPEVDSGVGQTRGLSRRTRRLSRVDRVRLSRVDRLLRNIETAQFGQQMVAHPNERPPREPQGGGVVTRPRSPHAPARAPIRSMNAKSERSGQAVQKEKSPMAAPVPMDAPKETGNFIADFIRLPRTSAPAGSVSLDVTCDRHGGRLMRLWMSRQARGVTLFGGEGSDEAWDTETSGRGALVVKCTRPGCREGARLTNDWLEARLLHVRADFEAGQGLPIARIPLSQVGVF